MGEDEVYTKDGTVDYQGNPANKKKTGTWKACPFILGTLLLKCVIFVIMNCEILMDLCFN